MTRAPVGDGSEPGPADEALSSPADSRYAAIDLGSNSFHMVVARGTLERRELPSPERWFGLCQSRDCRPVR